MGCGLCPYKQNSNKFNDAITKKKTFLGELPKNEIITGITSESMVTVFRLAYEKVKKEKKVQVKSTMFAEKVALTFSFEGMNYSLLTHWALGRCIMDS